MAGKLDGSLSADEASVLSLQIESLLTDKQASAVATHDLAARTLKKHEAEATTKVQFFLRQFVDEARRKRNVNGYTFAEAMEIYERFMKWDDYKAYVNGANCLKRMGNPESAVALAHRATELEPNDSLCWIALGNLKFAMGMASQQGGLREESEPYELRFSGPTHLPFDHDDVRVYLDNLFTDGLLIPTDRVSRSLVEGTWMAVGVTGSELADHTLRFRKLLDLLHSDQPSASSDHHTWVQVASRWAEVLALRWSLEGDVTPEDKDRFNAAHQLIEQSFYQWMGVHFASLHSLSYLPRPIMVHQIPKYMAHQLNAKGSTAKLAVVIVDGLAMDQWAVVRQEMPRRKWVMEEFGAFAWVPTLTSVSRQSIFAGDPPFYFGQSLDTTRKEEQHWSRFWEDRGLRKGDAVYACQGTLEDDDVFIARVSGELAAPRCRVAGIVVGTVDQMLHGIVTGTDGMHAGVRHWAKRGALWRLLDALLDHGFEVVLWLQPESQEATRRWRFGRLYGIFSKISSRVTPTTVVVERPSRS